MADVEVMHAVTETKKTRKVKKTTKRRESSDQGSEITITEIEQTTSENDKGYGWKNILIRRKLRFSKFNVFFIENSPYPFD